MFLTVCYSLTTNAVTSYDGVTRDLLPSYYHLDGTNGIWAPVESKGGNLDYLIMVWIRPSSSNEELGRRRETIIEIPNRLLCEFSQ